MRSFDFPYLTTEISKGAGRFPSSCFSAGADIGATLGMTAVEVFLASLITVSILQSYEEEGVTRSHSDS